VKTHLGNGVQHMNPGVGPENAGKWGSKFPSGKIRFSYATTKSAKKFTPDYHIEAISDVENRLD
jgi:hypothetical protein